MRLLAFYPKARSSKLTLFVAIFCFFSCSSKLEEDTGKLAAGRTALLVGAERTQQYAPKLQGKRLGLVVNPTSTIGSVHLVDTLLGAGLTIDKIFAPEHGFRGTADAGATVADGYDQRTGLPVVSLYGSKKKPDGQDLSGIDVLVFDIQDVGARFYTYISTLHYIMEAAAEQDISLWVLDRPNPNGHYVDGPTLEPAFRSFVGMHPIPVVHGLTVGELALMINGEGWLAEGKRCSLTVVPCANYDHQRRYDLPITPSPNLPNARSVYLYPWLCFFEGTTVSIGRGTTKQFQVYGHPDFPGGTCTFRPVSRPGATSPKHEGRECRGFCLGDMSVAEIRSQARLDLSYLLDFYASFPEGAPFFLANNFFDRLAGTARLRKQILEGYSEAEIRATWAADLAAYREMRKAYLIYEE